MFFYDMNLRGDCSLYEYLYRCIRHDIAHGTIAPGEKLPSKRNLAKHLGVSLITVEAAYQQLAAEGYIRSRERCGYYASDLAPAERVQQTSNEGLEETPLGLTPNASGALCEANDNGGPHANAQANSRPGYQESQGRPHAAARFSSADASRNCELRPASSRPSPTSNVAGANGGNVFGAKANGGNPIIGKSTSSPAPSLLANFTHSTLATELFPYATWAKTMRKTLSDESAATLAEASSAAGSPQLRQAIADHLREYRGMHVDARQIVVGAGSQTLYQLVVQLLGRNRTFAVETPGYPLLARMYQQQNVQIAHVSLDAGGIAMEQLAHSGASVAHIMPSHQFPTGIVTTASRRRELLNWAREGDRYLIEDDYDAEFRMAGRPIPPLFSIDAAERVLYLNSFAKSLGTAFRMAYLVLPPRLAQQFHAQLGFYANTVSPLDQLALARFIKSGSYERHVNRLRTRARKTQDALVGALREHFGSSISFAGLNNGLHFIMQLESRQSEAALTTAALKHGIRIAPLSQFDESGNTGATNVTSSDNTDPVAAAQFILRSDATDAESAETIAAALANAWS